MPILAHVYLLVILLWSPYVDSPLVWKSCLCDGYNCSNTCLYALWSTLSLILMHSSSFFSRFMFDEFIVKGGEYGHKVVELFANRVVERRNMINNYLRGRACIEIVRGSIDFEHLCWFWVFLALLSFCVDFKLFLLFWAFLNSSLPFCLALLLFMYFVGFCGFPSSRWLSYTFVGFLGLLAVLHGVFYWNFKLCTFVVNGLIKGEIEKPSGQFLVLIVMSHWLGDVWIQIWDSFVLFFFYFVSLENHVCLSRSVQVVGAAWCAATRTVAGVGDQVQRTEDAHTG
jgi:hypothetical protein